jgi:DNA repair exonuclease SbcCD ATPase subunit
MGVGPERRDREWENWPGRSTPDGSVRGRLRGLFSPTDDAESEIEEIIEARGRDLELRTAELTSTIGDLQRREEETRALRGEIEAMLRDGAEELDQRHAQLSALSTETIRREAELEKVEQALEERRQELGAVELRRAAVERREATLSSQQGELERIRDELAARVADAEERVSDLDQRRADVEQRSAELAARAVELDAMAAEFAELERIAAEREQEQAGVSYDDTAHVLLVPGSTYRLVHRDGSPPTSGDRLLVDERAYLVTRVGRSPLPGDHRGCAFLEIAS